MRKVLLVVAVAISAVSFGQVKKPVREKVVQDSVVIKFTRLYDTSKVRMTLFVEDGTLAWIDGYQIKGYLKISDSDIRESGELIFKDKKFIAVRQEDIQNLSKVNWK